jgi:hypothetical protein
VEGPKLPRFSGSKKLCGSRPFLTGTSTMVQYNVSLAGTFQFALFSSGATTVHRSVVLVERATLEY